ncbi:MAG: hypothetical protein AB1444_07105 [Spirochaetota bacterium]
MEKPSTAHHSKRTYWEGHVTQYNASGMSKVSLEIENFYRKNIESKFL